MALFAPSGQQTLAATCSYSQPLVPPTDPLTLLQPAKKGPRGDPEGPQRYPGEPEKGPYLVTKVAWEGAS